MTMRFPNPKLLTYIAMGDAYGMAVEYIKFPRDLHILEECREFTRYSSHPVHKTKPGGYTDDTEMSAANTHVLLGDTFSTLAFADAYVREFQRGGKRDGYSRGFQAILQRINSGKELLDTVVPDSDKNGAAMRSVPFGVLSDIDFMFALATVQARITHNTAVGRFSARAVALMSHFALYEDKPFSEMRDYCIHNLPEEDEEFLYVFEKDWDGSPVKGSDNVPVGLTTVHAVATLCATKTSLKDILLTAIEWGGDVDSVAAIAWGIASTRYQNEQIPEFLERDLEGGNPHTGAQYLTDLGTRLMEKYK
jgi:ADP-ribosylglycohydrolase